MTTRERGGASDSARTTDRDAPTGPLAESGVRRDRFPSDAPTMLAAASQPSSSASSSASPGSPDGASVAASGAADTLHASSPDASGSLAPGTVLDGVYRVEKQIGRGAMGAVYLVEHLRLGRKFATKVVAPGHATNADIVQRLRNEARVASQIHHENIVDVTHLGQAPDGSLFVVMELLEGRDLRDWIADRDGPSAFDDVRAIAADVMAGLAAAHEGGIVHRDLKPDNVFLVERSGRMRAKIVDFGISKSTHTDEDLRLTRTGQIMGTPLYMAPEQTRSTSDVDARADQYALGVMLYELLTGRLPFEATHLYDIVVKHATEPPPSLRSVRADVPAAVEAVVLRCLAKKPDARFESVVALRAAWDAAWDAPEIEVPVEVEPAPIEASIEPAAIDVVPLEPSSRPPDASGARRPRALAIAAVLFLLIGAPLAYLATRPDTATTAIVTVPRAPDPRASDPAPLHPVPADPVAPDPVPIAPELPAIAASPAPILRTIHSDPEGATVRIADRDVGVTPHVLELTGDAPIAIELRLRGHRRETRTISASDPEALTIPLRRAPQDRAPELAPR